ncbi:DUF1990 family protein [Parafrankia elaeagni]|nr:DUF1990 family protein [Parafrankia elaeagni]
MSDHPEVGEEAFVVERDAAGTVWRVPAFTARDRAFATGTSDPCLPA